MTYLSGPSLDMANDNVPSLTFVRPPDSQQITQTRDIPKTMVFAPENDIKDIQDYLKNDDDVNALINEKYQGPIDGKINKELVNIAKKLEAGIYTLINKNVDGIILQTNVKDLKKSVKTLLAFKKLSEPKQHKISQDQRIYELGKLKLKNNHK